MLVTRQNVRDVFIGNGTAYNTRRNVSICAEQALKASIDARMSAFYHRKGSYKHQCSQG